VDKVRKPIEFLPIIRPTLVEFDEVEAAFREVWRSGQLTVGPYTRCFEESVAQTLGVRHAVAVSSCTSGLMPAVKALELTGEVIVPSFTFAATVHALIRNNCTPVFVDCEDSTYNIDVTQTESLITERTSAIMPVYTYGLPPRLDEIERLARKQGLKVLCDSAPGQWPCGRYGFGILKGSTLTWSRLHSITLRIWRSTTSAAWRKSWVNKVYRLPSPESSRHAKIGQEGEQEDG